MWSRFLEKVRSRTYDEWREHFRDILVDSRVWVQEHSERSCGLAFLAGVVIVAFLRVFVVLLAVGVIALFLLYQIVPQSREEPAAEGDEKAARPGNRNGDGSTGGQGREPSAESNSTST